MTWSGGIRLEELQNFHCLFKKLLQAYKAYTIKWTWKSRIFYYYWKICAKKSQIIEILLKNLCKCFLNSIGKFMVKVQFSRVEGWSCSFISPQKTFQKNCLVEQTGTSAYCLFVNLDMFNSFLSVWPCLKKADRSYRILNCGWIYRRVIKKTNIYLSK